MPDPNIEKERLRLQKVYAQMFDGELVRVAEDMDSLTDVARETLRAEIERRGLKPEPEPEPEPKPESHREEAHLAAAASANESLQRPLKFATVADFFGIPKTIQADIQPEKVYARMLDGELIHIAEDMPSLTEQAQEALQAEFQRRGLTLPPVKKPNAGKKPIFERLYASMLDAELLDVANGPDSLPEVARDALKAELDRRGLDPTVIKEPPVPAALPGPDAEIVTVASYRDLPEALLAKGRLESAGIPCFLENENLIRTDWFYSNAIGGVLLQVREEDAKKAVRLLQRSAAEEIRAVEVSAGHRAPRCPKCNSRDITFESLNKSVTYSLLFFGLPIPVKANHWRCNACGCRWDGQEFE